MKAGLAEHISDWEFSNAMDLLTMRTGTITNVKYAASFFSIRLRVRFGGRESAGMIPRSLLRNCFQSLRWG